MTKCAANKYPDNSDRTCKFCHEECRTCSGPTKNDCTGCYEPKYYHKGKCIYNCPSGFYHDKDSMECKACHAHCSSCEGASDK